MTRAAPALGLCLAICAPPVLAQPAPEGPPAPRTMTVLFISPCGEPFRGPFDGPYPVAAWFARTDANADGALDRAEFRVEANAFFKVLDVNQDGVITSPEISRYEHVIVPEIAAHGRYGARDPEAGEARIFLAQVDDMGAGDMTGGMGGGHGMGGIGGMSSERTPGRATAATTEGASPYTLFGVSQPVSSSDRNLDGRVTLAEFIATSDQRFARLDTDGDGKVKLADLPQTMIQRALASRKGGKLRRPPT